MTAESIELLLQTVPDRLLPQLRHGCKNTSTGKDSHKDPDISRYVMAYKDLALGWKLARLFAENNIPFPCIIEDNDEPLFRAYLHIKGYKDKNISKALALSHPDNSGTSRAIKALLVAGKSEEGAVTLGQWFDFDVIMTFEKLFFNVIDRKCDAFWLAQMVYPGTKMVEYYNGYLDSADLGQLLIRAGYNNGHEDVLGLIGIGNPVGAMSAAQSQPQLEALMMSTGYILARNGWINQTNHTASINHARQLMAAAKIGGEDGGNNDDFSQIGDVLMSELHHYKRAEFERKIIDVTLNA